MCLRPASPRARRGVGGRGRKHGKSCRKHNVNVSSLNASAPPQASRPRNRAGDALTAALATSLISCARNLCSATEHHSPFHTPPSVQTAALDDLAHSLQQPPGAVSASSHTSQPSIDDEAERFANALSLQRSHQAADDTFDPLRAVSDAVFQSSPKAAPASNNVTQAHSKHSKRLRRKERSGALEAKAAGLSKKRSQRREKKRRRKESKEDAHQQLRLREIDNAMDGN